MKTIAVFFGGTSPEHDISILTGIQAFHAFDMEKYQLVPVYVTRDGLWYTGDALVDTQEYKNIDALIEKSKPVQIKKTRDGIFLVSQKTFGSTEIKLDAGFLAFHGGMGEGGSFQGYCETIGLPYTGSGVLGSSLCMDKVSMKKMIQDSNIPVSPYLVASEQDFTQNQEQLVQKIESGFGYPLFIKPANGGSSIGVSRAKDRVGLVNALELAFSFDAKVLVEQEFVHDAEINISCLGSWDGDVQISVAEEVYSDNEFLDFENKYLKGAKSKKVALPSGSKGMASTNRKIPAEISEVLESQIKQYAEQAFRMLNCSGVARIDFLVNKKENKLVLVEVNTIPGSLAYYLWEATNMPFQKLITTMIDLAFARYEKQAKHARTFASNIFKNL